MADRWNRTWIDRLVERVLRRRLNAFAKSVVMRAQSDGKIDSYAAHEVCGQVDRRLWPERYGAAACGKEPR